SAARDDTAGGDRGRGACRHSERRCMAADDHLAIEAEPSWSRVAGTCSLGGAQRKAVHVGAIERRHVDRRRYVGRQHARERRVERPPLALERRKRDVLCEARARVRGRDYLEKLLLARGPANRRDKIWLRRLDALVHGKALTTTSAPAG